MPQQPTHPLVEEWLADCSFVAANKANATSVLNHFHRWCKAGGLEVATVRRRDLRAYLEHHATTPTVRTGRPPAQATQRGTWRHLKAFYTWAATAVDEGGGGELDANPMAGIKGLKVSDKPTTKRADPVDIRALERVFDSGRLGRRNAAMVSLMFRSGLRVGELPWLDLADLRRRPDGRVVLAVPVTKSDEPRLVPLHAETVRYLDRYLRDGRHGRGPLPGPLFLGATNRTDDVNGRLKTKAITQMIERAAKRAGIRVAAHQLRRTWTSEYLRAGGDTLSMEVIGGWNDPRMPRRYLADEEASASIDRGGAARFAGGEPPWPPGLPLSSSSARRTLGTLSRRPPDPSSVFLARPHKFLIVASCVISRRSVCMTGQVMLHSWHPSTGIAQLSTCCAL